MKSILLCTSCLFSVSANHKIDFFEIQRRIYANLPNGASLNRLKQKHKLPSQPVLYQFIPILTRSSPCHGLISLSLIHLGLASLGLASLGLASLGLASLGLASLGLVNLGQALSAGRLADGQSAHPEIVQFVGASNQ